MHTIRPLVAPAAIAVATMTMLGCQSEPPMTFAEPPPATVVVEQPELRGVAEYAEFTGITQALDAVDVRARVPGFLEAMHFEPGEAVEKNQLLFTIEKDAYETALNQAQANLARAQAESDLAEATLRRMEAALRENAISEVQVIEQRAARDRAQAEIEAAKAAVERAELDLSYTDVRAPIAGRVSRDYIDVGNVVGGTDLTVLARIIQDTPIYAVFNVDENQYLAFRRAEAQRGADDSADDLPLFLGLADEADYPHEGYVDYAEPELDPGTGTIALRGIFPNDQGFLEPGMFCRLRLPLGPPREQLLIPQRAISTDLAGKFVYVVEQNNTVRYQSVELSFDVGDKRVVTRGLTPADRIVVDGLQKARPGAVVNPVRPGELPATGAGAPGASGAAGAEMLESEPGDAPAQTGHSE